ncbi:hypothetical protein BC936DRAFT_140895 [Jimgerdemannia flammicorona]|uniref:Uncharacterized protein n=1 Tax=Jimgerdemannia flammicorona TaxID=994334 RepID=A0A433A3C2_9FUNG|nr:hypothetical protein BC936DRAFT_140895 [Jimgerdemannia flammicorona]
MIYPDTLVSHTPSAPQLPSVIFETALPPSQPLPNIVPMRRGRPVRQEKREAGSQAFQNSSISEFDPFDPFDPSRPANDAPGFSNNPTADLFSLNESSSFQSSLLNSNEFNNNGFVTGNSTSFAATSFNLPPNPSQMFSPPPDVSQPTIGLNSSGSAPKRLLTGDNSGLSIDLSADSSAAMPLTGTFAAISLQADQQPSRATSPPFGTPSTSLTTNFFHFDAKRASTSALTPAHHHTFDQLTRTHSGGSNANPWQPQQFQSQPQPSSGQVSPPQPTPTRRESSAGSFASNSSTLASSSNIPSPQESQNNRTPSPRLMSPPSTKSSITSSPSTYQSRQYPISSQSPLVQPQPVQPQPEQPLAQQQKPYKPVPPPKPVRFKLSTTSSTTSSTTVSPTVPVTKINQQNFGELTTPTVRTGTMTLPSSTTSMDAFLSKFPPAEALDAHVTQQIGGEMLAPRIGSATPGHSQTPPTAPTRPLRPTRSYSDNQV